MADLTITDTQVVVATGQQETTRKTSVAVTAGKVVYANASGLWALAQCDTTDAEAAAAGITLNGGAVGQTVTAITGGIVTLGAGAAPAQAGIFCVSPNAGGIAPYADILAGMRLVILGIGMGSNQVKVGVHITGATKP